MQPMIDLPGVSKYFAATKALQSLNRTVPQSMTTVLIGPSGCGKSTLLRLIIGLIRPDGGTISFAGSRVVPDVGLMLRRRMGYVIQEGGLFPHLSGSDNVTLMARYLKWDRVRIEERVQELAGLSRIPFDILDRFPGWVFAGYRISKNIPNRASV